MPSAVVIIIPCYNEARRLKAIQFKEYCADSPTHHFVFVNDGSSDTTLTVLEALHEADPNHFTFLDLPTNVGKAEAVRQGLLLAFAGNPNFAGYWDADLATPLEAIPSFCELLESRLELEMVFGARVRLLGRSIERNPLRHYFGRAFATAASLTLGLPIYDTQCGAKLFRASPLVQALFQQPFTSRWLFDVEIIARLIQTCRRDNLAPPSTLIYEFPLHTWHDVAGSKVRPYDFFKSVVDLSKIYVKYLKNS
jgi:glycosyltransferase involved in cell wall biosynthesis